MGYFAAISLGMQLAAKVTVLINKYKHLNKHQVIGQVVAKLNETLDEMIIE